MESTFVTEASFVAEVVQQDVPSGGSRRIEWVVCYAHGGVFAVFESELEARAEAELSGGTCIELVRVSEPAVLHC